ncbi:MAG: tRNA (adenosine(37)-N6)-threonylcarbamoyltransferase complex dimerization subunit type 1 TsaB [Candidatus Acidiferrales bacterium]
MLLLAVDTATPAGSVAVLRDGRLVGVVSTSVDETYSTRLFRQLDFLLAELQLKMDHFDVFAVAAGPGSFTGIRVGLAAVKAWAEVYGKPVVSLSGLEAVAAQAAWPNDADYVAAPVLRAGRGQIYGALYRRRGADITAQDQGQACTAEEFLAYVAEHAKDSPVQFLSPQPEIIQSALQNSKLFPAATARNVQNVQKVSPVLAPILAELGFARATRGEFTDALRLDANYIQRSDAEVSWKGP